MVIGRQSFNYKCRPAIFQWLEVGLHVVISRPTAVNIEIELRALVRVLLCYGALEIVSVIIIIIITIRASSLKYYT